MLLGEQQTLQLILDANDDAVQSGTIAIRSSTGLRIRNCKEGVAILSTSTSADTDGSATATNVSQQQQQQTLAYKLESGQIQLPALARHTQVMFHIPILAPPERSTSHEVQPVVVPKVVAVNSLIAYSLLSL